MADDDDDDDDADFFGDLIFNSKLNTISHSVTAPMAADSFDDDWGDFVSTRSAQIDGQDSLAVTRADSAPSWVKPSGALPLSLFGEAEEEKSGAGESVFGYGEPIVFSDEKKKNKKGSSLTGGVGIGDLIANLYGRSDKINAQNESVSNSNANSSDWTQNGYNIGFHNVDSSLSNFDSGTSGLNSNSNGLSADLVQQSENFDDDDDYGWEFKGADGNELEHQTVEAPPGLKVEIINAKDSEIQVDRSGRGKVEESKSATTSSNGLPGLVDASILSSNTSNEVGDWSFALDFDPSSVNQNGILWDAFSKSKENSAAKIGSDFSFVAENGNSKDNFWQFEDAFSGAGAHPQFAAAKVSASADLVIQTVNGDGASVPTNFFVQSEGTSHRPEQWDHGFTFSSGSEHEDIAISHVTLKSKENDNGEGLSSSQGDKDDEFEENVWEFRDADSDTGSKKEEDSKVSPDPPANIIPSGLDGANQGNEIRPASHRDALPLSLFGDEELETNASSVDQDASTHTLTTYTRNINNNSSSNLSINDLISSLYGQAEQSNSVHDAPKASGNEPHSVVRPEESDLVYPNGDFDDDSWEFKDASWGAKDQNQTFITHCVDSPTKSSAALQLDYFIDFYCKLKDESCYIALNHFESLKKAQSSIVEALGEDAQEFYDQLCRENMISEFHLENLSQRSSGISELFQVLHEPKFSVLDSKFHLSNMLSLAEKDLESAVKISQHATSTLRIVKLGSAEEQSVYVSTWSKILSVCAQELQHGSSVWNQALQKGVADQISSEPQGRQYITALGEIYRVVQVLGTSAKLYKPWVLLNSEGPGCLYALLNECTSLWSTSGLDEAIQNISEPIDSEFDRTLTDLLGSIKHVDNLDTLALHDHVFSSKEPLMSIVDVKSWNRARNKTSVVEQGSVLFDARKFVGESDQFQSSRFAKFEH